MSGGTARADGDGDRSLATRQALDAGVYAGVVLAAATGVAVVVGQLLSVNVGCGLVHGLVIAKRTLFFLGFAVLAAGAFVMRPRTSLSERDASIPIVGGSGDDDGDRDAPAETRRSGRNGASSGPVQRVVDRALSELSVRIPPGDRITTGWKVVAAGFAVLGLTVAMELAGLHVGNYPC